MLTNRMGATLYELLLALTLIGVFTSLAMPAMRSAMDSLAVRAARESAFGMFARARALALQQGGAQVELSARSDHILVHAPSGAIEAELLLGPQHIDLIVEGPSDPVLLRYDAYGLGRMMSRTITFQGRAARSGLTISSFGRVRRW